MFKKITALVLSLVLAAACLAGCSSNGKTLKDIQSAGKLTIATSPDFPPFETLDGEKVVGIEIDIMEMICKELGVELDIKQMSFDSVIPGVQSGKYDVGVSGISVTPKREKSVKFTTPYCLAAQAIVVPTGSEITCKADLEGLKIAVQSGTTAETFCMENGYSINSYKGNTDAQLALTTGKVAAWVIDDLTAAEMVEVYNGENPDAPLVILEEAMTTEPYAFAFNLDSAELVAEVDKILSKLVEDGTVAALFEKYNAPYTSPVK